LINATVAIKNLVKFLNSCTLKATAMAELYACLPSLSLSVFVVSRERDFFYNYTEKLLEDIMSKIIISKYQKKIILCTVFAQNGCKYS